MSILLPTNMCVAPRRTQRGFLLNPFVFGGDALAVSIYSKIVGWWELDEPSGTAVSDSHTNALHGTSSGMTVNQSALGANLGKAYASATTTSYVDIPHASALSLTGALSVLAWTSFSNGTAYYPKLLWKRGVDDLSGRANYYLGRDNIDNGGKAVFRVSASSTNYSVLTASALSNSTPYMLVGTRNGQTLRIYVNGALSNTNSSGPAGALSTSSGSGGSIRCGYAGDTTRDPIIGTLDQRAVFNAELTAAEIAYLFSGGAGMSYAALAAAAGH